MNKHKKKSGVSCAINSILSNIKNNENVVEFDKPKNYRIKIANTLEDREAVYRLGYNVYLDKNFIKKNNTGWLIYPYDFETDTTILVVKDNSNKTVGSLTMVFDFDKKLPADNIFLDEINSLRFKSKKIVEISRLVIDPQFRNSKEILILLFNYLAIYSFLVKKYDTIIIEVNPRHIEYYKEALCFEEIGKTKLCPQVNNAPANLMMINSQIIQEQLHRCRTKKITDKKERSLYQYYINEKNEYIIADYLSKQTRPISYEEKQYFGFSESGLMKALISV